MNRGQIMNEDEQKEILDWIYKNKSEFKNIRDNKLHYVIVENKDEVNKTLLNMDIVYPYNSTYSSIL